MLSVNLFYTKYFAVILISMGNVDAFHVSTDA